MPKVSIIVPVYKAEKYLRECIDSIISQTFNDWECILVDDGSPDMSGAICDEYARRDPRIRVIHKENGGVSSARNEALGTIASKWLTFVDSDDSLYPNTLELLVDVAEQNELDFIQCYFNREYIEGQVLAATTEVLSASQYADTENYLTSVWGALFKTSIIREHSLRFDENLRLGEDQIFLLNYIQYCKRIQRLGDALYFYRNNGESAVNNPKPEYEIASVKAFILLKSCNHLAQKQCDYMLLSWLTSLVINSATPSYELQNVFQNIKIKNLRHGACGSEKLLYCLQLISMPLSIRAGKLLRSIKYIIK